MEPTALRDAIARNDPTTVRTLLAADPELARQALDGDGHHALHLAAHADAADVAEALLAAGADFYARDANGQLALDLPPGQELNAVRRRLRAINGTRNQVFGAVVQRQLDAVRGQLATDPTLAATRDIGDGWSLVMVACHHGDEAMLDLLLAAGAPRDAVDFASGHDALLLSALNGHPGCLRRLLAAGADPRRTWTVGYGSLPMAMNALHVAAWKGHAEVVTALLAAGVPVDARARSYALFTPLHFAATEGHAAVVRLLLAAGADRAARDGRRGKTALEMAGDKAEVVELLR